MKLKVFIVILFLLPVYVFAQHTSNVAGIVADSAGIPLEHASISILQLKDSTVAHRALSDTTGFYAFTSVMPGNYRIQFSYEGYQNTTRLFSLTDSTENFIIDTIKMYTTASELNEVVVLSTAKPITIRGDTTEFNVSQIGVKPNATAEDVLKKLAGIEVEKDGSIKAQGERVRRVYVDGKRFFGDDPKMATQNLPSDVIEKVQIIDASSDQAEFSGFDDGNRVRTINIVTKQQVKNGGYFGKGTAAIGTRDLHAVGGNIYRFRGDEQISVLGQWNNNNQQMFSLPSDMGGGRRGFQGNNNTGQTRAIAGGMNYRNTFGKTQLYGNYFYNNTDLDIQQDRLRQNLLQGDTVQNNFSDSYSNRKRENHNFNFNIETQFDSLNSLIVRPRFSYQQAENTSISSSEIWRAVLADSTGISRSNRTNTSNNDGIDGGLELTYRHQFAKSGRTLSLNTHVSAGRNEGYGESLNNVFTYSNNRNRTTNQHYTSGSENNAINATLSYTEAIAKNHQLELNFNYSYSTNNSERITYNFDSTTMDYTVVDSTLTNKYENTYASQRATLNYRYFRGKINLTAGSGVQFGQRESNNISKDLHLKQDYINLFPTANLSYRISTTKNLRVSYSGRTSQPSISQLQPVLDNSDQLYIIDGNPDLRQSFNNDFNIRYASFDREKSINMFILLSGSVTSNAIVNSVTQLSNGGQYVQPVNMNGVYTLNGFFNYGFPVKKPKSNVNLSTELSNGRTVSLVDGRKNFTSTTTIGQRLRWNTNLKETFDINFATKPMYNFAKYTVNKNLDGNYYSQSISLDATWYTKSGWITAVDFDYTFFRGLSEGFNTSIPLLQASVAKQLFKNKAGELRLTVFDVLNQNKSIINTRTDNYIQQTRSNVLQRYAMLSFTYNVRNFAGRSSGSEQRQRGEFGNRGPRGGGRG